MAIGITDFAAVVVNCQNEGVFVLRAIASAKSICLLVALRMFRVNQNETFVVKSANTMLTLQTQGVAPRHGNKTLLAALSLFLR